MKLTVIFADLHAVRCNIEMTGIRLAPAFRRVTIELSDHLADQLKPRKVGTTCGDGRFEEIQSIFFEE